MIRIDRLKKSFGALRVLNGLTLTIRQGEITAIVGPNGSGKTTLIKSILGLVKPDAGTIHIGAERLNGDCRYRAGIGYMPQIGRYPENLRVRDVLAMVKDLRQDCPVLDEELIDQLELRREMDKHFGHLSGGTRQKVSAVIATLFNPGILILDEPTAGLDPVASSILKDKVIAERIAGKTIILTSHIMAEVEELSDTVIFLLDGRVRFSGSPREILQNTGETSLERGIARMMQRVTA